MLHGDTELRPVCERVSAKLHTCAALKRRIAHTQIAET